ncbi:hypothetical protein HJFPF1_08238 [Paramyrothecium foliicola]|nr:hypothetical protein HJFPF1_08238 [Paramyrothecium foliicola]
MTVLGLDVGTTASRACLLRLKQENDVVEKPHLISSRSPKSQDQTLCDFSNLCNPFRIDEAPEKCFGPHLDTSEFCFPLKMYHYLVRTVWLAKQKKLAKLKQIRARIPQVDQLWRRMDQCPDRSEAFRDRIVAHMEAMFVVHLKEIREISDKVANGMSMRITQLAVTLPPNWDPALQKINERVLMKVWPDIGPDNVALVYESEAVGHWLLRTNAENLRSDKPKKVILVDFGGHTIGTYIFDLEYGHDGNDFAFFASSDFDANCSHAGSELHHALVKAKLDDKISLLVSGLQPNEVEQLTRSCMQFYKDKIRGNVSDEEFFLDGLARPRDASAAYFRIKFSQKESQDMYRKCFQNALEELDSLFKQVPIKTKETVVVLSGGTFQSLKIWNETDKLINDNGLKHLTWINRLVDSGLATVEKFLSQSAIVLDICRRPGEPDEPLEVLYSSGNTKSVEVSMSLEERGQSDRILSCAPISPGPDVKTAQRSATYQLNMLSRLHTGRWKISLDYKKMTYRGHPNTDCLIYKEFRLGVRVPAREHIWPIYYDPGGCALFVDNDMVKEVEQGSSEGYGKANSVKNRFRKIPQYRSRWENEQLDGARFWEDDLSMGPGAEALELWAQTLAPQASVGSATGATQDAESRSLREAAAVPLPSSTGTVPAGIADTRTRASRRSPTPALTQHQVFIIDYDKQSSQNAQLQPQPTRSNHSVVGTGFQGIARLEASTPARRSAVKSSFRRNPGSSEPVKQARKRTFYEDSD